VSSIATNFSTGRSYIPITFPEKTIKTDRFPAGMVIGLAQER
jgi:hypothetical protein